MPNTKQLEDFVSQVRRDIVRQVHQVSSGHPGGSLGCTEFFVALYQEVMKRKEGFDMDKDPHVHIWEARYEKIDPKKRKKRKD